MGKMAGSFNTTVPALEDELTQLILDDQIQARIDSHNKVMQAIYCLIKVHRCWRIIMYAG